MRDRRRHGSATAPLLVLLLVLGAAGGWNYHRNLELEKAEQKTRPFQGYADADLGALAEAYRSEVADWQRRHAGAARRRAPGRGQAGLLDQNVREFERVQRRSGELRGITAEIATREHRLAEIVAEQELRASDPTGFSLHLKRLVTI